MNTVNMFYLLYVAQKREFSGHTGRDRSHAQLSQAVFSPRLIQLPPSQVPNLPTAKANMKPWQTNKPARETMMTLDFSDFEKVSAFT